MKIFYRLSLNTKLIMFVFILLSFVASCQTEYTTQHFSFPPGSKAHEQGSKCILLVIVSTSQTPITKKSGKKVKIKIYDKNKRILLDDGFDFISASIKANVVWNDFDNIHVELTEIGNKFSEDNYNKKLIKHGPAELIILNYKYNKQSNVFERAI